MEIMNNSLVSVIIPVFNAELTIRRALDSIINQTYKNIEIIIVDDGSTDNTLQEINQIQDHRIKIIKNIKNLGISKTFNKGLSVSTGNFIARQDADDYSDIKRIESQVKYLINNPDVDIVGSNAKLFDEKKIWGQISHSQKPEQQNWLSGCQIVAASMLLRSSVVKKIGGYSEDLPRAEDYEFFLRSIKNGFQIENVNEYLYFISWVEGDYKRRNIRILEIKIKLKYFKFFAKNLKSIIYILKTIVTLIIPSKFLFLYHKYKLKLLG